MPADDTAMCPSGTPPVIRWKFLQENLDVLSKEKRPSPINILHIFSSLSLDYVQSLVMIFLPASEFRPPRYAVERTSKLGNDE